MNKKNFLLIILFINSHQILPMKPKKNIVTDEDINFLIKNMRSNSLNEEKGILRKTKSDSSIPSKKNLTRTNSAPVLSETEILKNLTRAIVNSNPSDVKKYASKAIINRANRNERTPLMLAALFGNGTIVQLLLKNGADPNRTNKFGDSSLHIALMQKEINPGIIQLLLDADARIYLTNNKGETPIDLFKIAQKKNPALKKIIFK